MKTHELLSTLADFLEAGYSLSLSLSLIETMSQDRRITAILKDLADGKTVEEAFKAQKWDSLFLEYFIFFLRFGQLHSALRQALNIVEVKQNFFGQLKKTMTYPLLLFAFAMVFSLFVSAFLLPQVRLLYASFDTSPTPGVEIFFTVMTFLPLGLGCVFLLTGLFAYDLWRGLKRGNFQIVERGLKIPGVSLILRAYFSFKFALYYREASRHSHSLAKTFDLLTRDLYQSDLVMVTYDLKAEIEKGQSLLDAIKQSMYFTDYFKQIFAIGLYSGKMNEQLDTFVKTMMDQLTRQIRRIMKWLVPFFYAFSMGTVAGIYLMIILPMMNLVSNL